MKNLICEEFNPAEAGSYQISVEGIMFESAPYLKFDKVCSFEKYERPIIENWYDDIPEQGILCMVRDKFETTNEVALVCNKKAGVYFDRTGRCWDKARPATLYDLKKHLYEPAWYSILYK